jgi:HD superfamily phosphohydrolase YqeK
MPVDIPLVRPATIARLLAESENNPVTIIYPFFDGRRGHPPLIPASLIPSIVNFTGDGGLKAVLTAYADRSLDVIVPDSNILFDVDTAEDYRELLIRHRQLDIPTKAERRVIMNDICKAPQKIIQHCQKVAEVALSIGQSLNQAGQSVSLELIQAAAELHDLAREYPDHESEGARILRGMGFNRIAGIVAVHMDMPDDTTGIPMEAKIVFLADKIVQGTSVVTIEERYHSASLAYGKTPDIIVEIEARKTRALKVKREIEDLLHHQLPEPH